MRLRFYQDVEHDKKSLRYNFVEGANGDGENGTKNHFPRPHW